MGRFAGECLDSDGASFGCQDKCLTLHFRGSPKHLELTSITGVMLDIKCQQIAEVSLTKRDKGEMETLR